jgi:hypothetical protein
VPLILDCLRLAHRGLLNLTRWNSSGPPGGLGQGTAGILTVVLKATKTDPQVKASAPGLSTGSYPTVGRRHGQPAPTLACHPPLPQPQAQPAQTRTTGHFHVLRPSPDELAYQEDKPLVRTGNALRVMASLRSPAISLLRQDGDANIAAANRHHARDPQRTLKPLQTA